MFRKQLLLAAFALIAGAVVLFSMLHWRGAGHRSRPGFVQADGPRLTIDGRPFRFVGANLDLMFEEQTRSRMPETVRFAAGNGIKVVRIWASAEGGVEEGRPVNTWLRDHSFRRRPGEWNEAEFVFIDQ